MNKDVIGGAVRTLVIAAGGVAVGLGYASADDITALADNVAAIIGAASVVGGLVWSIVQKIRARKEKVTP